MLVIENRSKKLIDNLHEIAQSYYYWLRPQLTPLISVASVGVVVLGFIGTLAILSSSSQPETFNASTSSQSTDTDKKTASEAKKIKTKKLAEAKKAEAAKTKAASKKAKQAKAQPQAIYNQPTYKPQPKPATQVTPSKPSNSASNSSTTNPAPKQSSPATNNDKPISGTVDQILP